MSWLRFAAIGMVYVLVLGNAHCQEGQKLPKVDVYLLMADKAGGPTRSYRAKQMFPEIDDFYIHWEPEISPNQKVLVEDFSNVRGSELESSINSLSGYDELTTLILPGSELSRIKSESLKKVKNLSLILVDSCPDQDLLVKFKKAIQGCQVIESQQSAIDFVQKEDDGLTTAVLKKAQGFPASMTKFYDRHSYRVVKLTRRRNALPVIGDPLTEGIIDRLPCFASSLVTLDLSDSTINDFRMTLLQQMRLECLILDNTVVSEIGIRKLNCKTLKRLKCSRCKIQDKIPDMPVLEALDLHDNPIQDGFFKELDLPKLRLLDVSGTKLTSSALEEIEKYQSLEYLVVDESFRGAKELDGILKKKINVSFY